MTKINYSNFLSNPASYDNLYCLWKSICQLDCDFMLNDKGGVPFKKQNLKLKIDDNVYSFDLWWKEIDAIRGNNKRKHGYLSNTLVIKKKMFDGSKIIECSYNPELDTYIVAETNYIDANKNTMYYAYYRKSISKHKCSNPDEVASIIKEMITTLKWTDDNLHEYQMNKLGNKVLNLDPKLNNYSDDI